MKQYVGISRDHSGSMSSLREAAKKDYNGNISAIQSAAADTKIDTIVSVVRCGINNGVDREIVNSNIQMLRPLTRYEVDGQTPLFDSVGELIDLLSNVPDANGSDVSFLIMAVTDGQENASRRWTAHSLSTRIKELQATDRWTFVFRVPRGYSRDLEGMGIPSGNIQEWDQTERGMEEASVHTVSAVAGYYGQLSRGIRATDHFYANARNISSSAARSVMTDISNEVHIWPVDVKGQIRPFVESHIHRPMLLGSAFYQLTKLERVVQSNKMICIRERNTGKVYAGQSARDLLGLPLQGIIRLSPGDHGNWDIFIQSTSVNRLLVPGTQVLFWEGVNHAPLTRSARAR